MLPDALGCDLTDFEVETMVESSKTAQNATIS